MQLKRKRHIVSVTLTTLLLLVTPAFALLQEQKSVVASANGEGTLRIGKEKFKVNAVVVKLLEDGNAEITLVTDITVFVSGTWRRGSATDKVIDVNITGTATKGGVEGSGKIFLAEDGKSLAKLKFQALNKITNRNVELDFIAK
ncbi:MAG TPA: hypothetical protein VIG25_02710 [Pyrinomonadaceae bacterium]|jgi:hypothetical protein